MCRAFRERNKNISLYLLGWEFSDTVMVRLVYAFVYHETPDSVSSILNIAHVHLIGYPWVAYPSHTSNDIQLWSRF